MDYTNVLPGAKLGVSTTEANRRELFLKLFAGQVLNAFEDPTVNLMDSLVRQFSISGGKTLQIPATGYVQGAYHLPGKEIQGQSPQQSERTINVDDLLYVPLFFPSIYDALSHYQVRGEYAKKAGYTLAKAKNNAQIVEVLKAARSAATIPGVTNGGSQILSDKFQVGTGGAADVNEAALTIFEALFQAAEIMDQKLIPTEDRHCMLRPREYYTLVRAIQSNGFSLANKFFMETTSSINTGKLPTIAGFQMHKSNLLPKTNMTETGDPSGSGTPGTLAVLPIHSAHALDCTKTMGMIWHPEASATVTLMGLQVKTDYMLKNLGDLLVAYFVLGHGVVRPECSIELSLNATTVA